MNLYPREVLESMHTKQLLELRQSSEVDHEILREILAGRPHIPNKVEARKIRQEKAKQNQNR